MSKQAITKICRHNDDLVAGAAFRDGEGKFITERYLEKTELPTEVSSFNNDVGYITEHQDISGKYDKSGGEISGNVKIDGWLQMKIEDEDYNAGIQFTPRLDDNLGTVLTLTGYAHGQEQTYYKTLLRNIKEPAAADDAATKGYVDNKVNTTWIPGLDNEDGTLLLSSTAYNDAYNAVISNHTCFIKVTGTNGIFTLRLKDWIDYNNHRVGTDYFIFTEDVDEQYKKIIKLYKDKNEYLTVDYSENFEQISNKATSVINNVNDIMYPTVKAIKDYVDDEYGPHTIWETDGTTGLLGLNSNSAGNWQLEDLDFTPYKHVKVYVKMGADSIADYIKRMTPQIVCDIYLDDRGRDDRFESGSFAGTGMGNNPQDRNVFFVTMCVIDSTKTKFKCIQQISLYGTTVGGRNDGERYIYKIEGYKH